MGTVSKTPARPRTGAWLGVFILLALGVWLAASYLSGFREKSLSNLSLEPLMVALCSVLVFFGWFLVREKVSGRRWGSFFWSSFPQPR